MLFLILLALQGSLALTDDEVRALEDLASDWNYFGGLWPTESPRNACTPPTWFGLNCNDGADPHVTHLYANDLLLLSVFALSTLLALVVSYISLITLLQTTAL